MEDRGDLEPYSLGVYISYEVLMRDNYMPSAWTLEERIEAIRRLLRPRRGLDPYGSLAMRIRTEKREREEAEAHADLVAKLYGGKGEASEGP